MELEDEKYQKNQDNNDNDSMDPATRELIRKLEAENQEEIIKKNGNLIKIEAPPPSNNLSCSICLDDENLGEMWPLDGCEHIYHMECLKYYTKTQLDAGKNQMLCPDEKCTKEINPGDLRQIMTKEDLDKFCQYALNRSVE